MRRRLLPISVLFCLSLLVFPLRALVAGSLFLPLTLRAVSLVHTPTPEPTLPPDHTVYGVIYDQKDGVGHPVANARVAIVGCAQVGGASWTTRSDLGGLYSLSLPRLQLDACNSVLLEVTAAGYEPALLSVSVATLYVHPQQKVGLQALQAPPTVLATVQAPTPTQTGGTLVLAGRVYDASAGSGSGIYGAAVQVSAEGTQIPLTAATDAQGDYSLVVPADYCPGCQTLLIRVVALGYQSHSETVPVTTLRAQPLRDYALSAQEGEAMLIWSIER